MVMQRKYRTFYVFDEDEKLQQLEKTVDWYIGREKNEAPGHIQFVFGFKNPRYLSGVRRALISEKILPCHDPQEMIQSHIDGSKRDNNGVLYRHGKIPSFRKKTDNYIMGEEATQIKYGLGDNYIQPQTVPYNEEDKQILTQYSHVITRPISAPNKRGGGRIRRCTNYQQFMIDARRPKDCIYWDDVNILVNRLRLLMTSQADYPTHMKEIVTILEELKRTRIII